MTPSILCRASIGPRRNEYSGCRGLHLELEGAPGIHHSWMSSRFRRQDCFGRRSAQRRPTSVGMSQHPLAPGVRRRIAGGAEHDDGMNAGQQFTRSLFNWPSSAFALQLVVDGRHLLVGDCSFPWRSRRSSFVLCNFLVAGRVSSWRLQLLVGALVIADDGLQVFLGRVISCRNWRGFVLRAGFKAGAWRNVPSSDRAGSGRRRPARFPRTSKQPEHSRRARHRGRLGRTPRVISRKPPWHLTARRSGATALHPGVVDRGAQFESSPSGI